MRIPVSSVNVTIRTTAGSAAGYASSTDSSSVSSFSSSEASAASGSSSVIPSVPTSSTAVSSVSGPLPAEPSKSSEPSLFSSSVPVWSSVFDEGSSCCAFSGSALPVPEICSVPSTSFCPSFSELPCVTSGVSPSAGSSVTIVSPVPAAKAVMPFMLTARLNASNNESILLLFIVPPPLLVFYLLISMTILTSIYVKFIIISLIIAFSLV